MRDADLLRFLFRREQLARTLTRLAVVAGDRRVGQVFAVAQDVMRPGDLELARLFGDGRGIGDHPLRCPEQAGLIRASLDASIRYASERRAFGREIARFQLIQQKIAEMVQSYEVGRLLYLQAGWMKNTGMRNTRETSLAKWFATDASFKAASEAIQVHGAYGYSDEYDVERYLRNSRGAVIYEGTSEIHQLIQAGYALGMRKDVGLRKELPAYDAQFWQE